MPDPEVSATLYRDLRHRIIDVARTLDADQLRTTVPACPRWTVHHLLAHLAGVAADVVSDTLAGAPSEDWSAVHVAARIGRSVDELIDEWETAGTGWEEIARQATHPSFLIRGPYLDAGVHEADFNAALGLPRPPAELTLAIADTMVPRVAEDFDDLGLFTIVTPERVFNLGRGDAVASARVDTYEVTRAVLGRRSRAQIKAWAWSGDPGAFTERLPIFPQTEHDLVD
ncbi:MAG TPA: maleylpyruvate isomerase family mycothiol-dependent enzyme [Actinophytocola sp.]|jgi:uncharacterized protein (TIGR03083 family)|uniref:maleylpyruvate isomerase family mycothiol-dependent enzyme n=1 Tax=Actinophytocola sp. TaxID=1872138 RepID=UPI002E008232|nr:maleylpyruvate isomerase family mycothiol-dependent enzyme [Actinophytocola sp.]